MICAQEKTRPYAVALHEITEEDQDEARRRYTQDLIRVATCIERDEWPGYPQNPHPCPAKTWKRQDREIKEAIYGSD